MSALLFSVHTWLLILQDFVTMVFRDCHFISACISTSTHHRMPEDAVVDYVNVS